MSTAKKEVMLEHDVLFLGATRPAMMFGVTYDFMVINGMVASMIFLATGHPFYFLLAIPGHLVGFLVCMNDPRTFGIFFVWLTTMSKCPNRMFWKGSTYTPR